MCDTPTVPMYSSQSTIPGISASFNDNKRTIINPMNDEWAKEFLIAAKYPILRHIPKHARTGVSDSLSQCLNGIFKYNANIDDWNIFFNFAQRVLKSTDTSNHISAAAKVREA